jgi:hypothetical protein
LAAALLGGGASVHQRYYPGLTHTDPILEDPLKGDLSLMVDMAEQIHLAMAICENDNNRPVNMDSLRSRCSVKEDAMVSPMLVRIAKKINPF